MELPTPSSRQIPILHAAFYEAIIQAKAAGYLFLDLQADNPHATEGDQVYEINRFKAGFGGRSVAFHLNLNWY
jgi:lipid II:glycine glycyltransferase (peptidoglycan interpeptide bridge formation enzyme)